MSGGDASFLSKCAGFPVVCGGYLALRDDIRWHPCSFQARLRRKLSDEVEDPQGWVQEWCPKSWGLLLGWDREDQSSSKFPVGPPKWGWRYLRSNGEIVIYIDAKMSLGWTLWVRQASRVWGFLMNLAHEWAEERAVRISGTSARSISPQHLKLIFSMSLVISWRQSQGASRSPYSVGVRPIFSITLGGRGAAILPGGRSALRNAAVTSNEASWCIPWMQKSKHACVQDGCGDLPVRILGLVAACVDSYFIFFWLDGEDYPCRCLDVILPLKACHVFEHAFLLGRNGGDGLGQREILNFFSACSEPFLPFLLWRQARHLAKPRCKLWLTFSLHPHPVPCIPILQILGLACWWWCLLNHHQGHDSLQQSRLEVTLQKTSWRMWMEHLQVGTIIVFI